MKNKNDFQTDDTGVCIEFYYFMYGRDIDRLNVYWKTNGGEQDLVWTRKGTKGPRWIYGQVRNDIYIYIYIYKVRNDITRFFQLHKKVDLKSS